MTHEEAVALMAAIEEATGAPYAYDHFAEGESPDPPFFLFLFPESRNFLADDSVYFAMKELDIELYTDVKDPSLEESLEGILEANELVWEKTEAWIESERLYEVLYEMTV